jgi:hypothetical protein
MWAQKCKQWAESSHTFAKLAVFQLLVNNSAQPRVARRKGKLISPVSLIARLLRKPRVKPECEGVR